MIELSEKDGAVTLRVRVQPRAGQSGVVGAHGGALKVRIAAPPVEGRANEECRRFLAKFFGVPAGDVEIVTGDASKDKVIRIRRATAAQVREALGQLGGDE